MRIFVTWLGNRIVGRSYVANLVPNPGLCGVGWFVDSYGYSHGCNLPAGHASSHAYLRPDDTVPGFAINWTPL